MLGTVKFFNALRGFGFLTNDQNEDFFVHISNVEGEAVLFEGETVEFHAVESSKGYQALDVVRKDPPRLVEEEGVVRVFHLDRGYGFISRGKQKADVFVHLAEVEDQRPLQEGQAVVFKVRAQREGRDRAYQVRLR